MTPRQLADLFDRIGFSRAAAARELGIDERTLRRKLNGTAMIERVIELAARHLETLHQARIVRPATPPLVNEPLPPVTIGEGARPPQRPQVDGSTATAHQAPPAPTSSLLGPPRPTSQVLARMAEIKTRS